MEQTPPPQYPMPANPPAAPLVFGILNTLFGAIGSAATLMSLPTYFTPLENQGGPIPELMRADPFFASSMRIMAIPGVIYSLALLISGIGLFRAREWARKTAIFAALYALPAGIFGAYLNIWHTLPFTTEYALRQAPQLPDPQFAPMMKAMMQATGMAANFIALLFPILMIVFLTRSKVRVHCKAVSVPPSNLIA